MIIKLAWASNWTSRNYWRNILRAKKKAEKSMPHKNRFSLMRESITKRREWEKAEKWFSYNYIHCATKIEFLGIPVRFEMLRNQKSLIEIKSCDGKEFDRWKVCLCVYKQEVITNAQATDMTVGTLFLFLSILRKHTWTCTNQFGS